MLCDLATMLKLAGMGMGVVDVADDCMEEGGILMESLMEGVRLMAGSVMVCDCGGCSVLKESPMMR